MYQLNRTSVFKYYFSSPQFTDQIILCYTSESKSATEKIGLCDNYDNIMVILTVHMKQTVLPLFKYMQTVQFMKLSNFSVSIIEQNISTRYIKNPSLISSKHSTNTFTNIRSQWKLGKDWRSSF